MKTDVLKNIHIETQPGSQVNIIGEIPFEELEKHRLPALKSVGEEIEIDGFRKGHVPEAILIQRVGEMTILTEMAERTLTEYYPKIVATKALDVIGYPKISITKLAKGNPLGFSITVAVVPEIILPDYNKIASDINTTRESGEVSDDDVTKQIDAILRQKIAYERLQKKSQHETEEKEHVHTEECDHQYTEKDEDSAKDVQLPELTDDYVKTLGKPGQFETVTDFREKIKEHLTTEKIRDVASRHRAKITDAIIEKSVIELPQIMIDAEINQMFAQMKDDLERAQLSIEDYLVHIKKTKEELQKEWVPSAEKRAKLQLVLNEIAKKEATVPDQSMIDHEVSHLLEQYKDADKKRVRVYVTSILTNEAVLKKLDEM